MSRTVNLVQALPRTAWRLVAGSVVMVVLTLAAPVCGALTSVGRVDPLVWQSAAAQPRVNVRVVLGYKPEAFHVKHLQAAGTIGGVSEVGIELLRVARPDLELLARTAWISRIELLGSADR